MANILFINNDPATIQPIQEHLIKEGHHVFVTHRAEEGINNALSNHPDVIFVDPILPGATGSQVCFKLRNNAITHWTPIIMLDGSGKHPALQRFARAMGATEVVQKSTKVVELGDMVGRYVQMKTSRDEMIQAILYINRASPAPDNKSHEDLGPIHGSELPEL